MQTYRIEDQCYHAAWKAAKAVKTTEEQKKAGEKAYTDWGQTFKWGPEHYANPYFRLMYIIKLWSARFDEHFEGLKMMLKGPSGLNCKDMLTRFLEHRRQKGIIQIKLMSFGCGPGSDAVAAMLFLRRCAIKMLDIPKDLVTERVIFDVTLVDQEPGWHRIAKKAVKAAEPGGNVESLLVSEHTFESSEVAKAAASCDLISFSHVLVDVDQVYGQAPAAKAFQRRLIRTWASQTSTRNNCKILHMADRFDPGRAVLPGNVRETKFKAYPNSDKPKTFISLTPVEMKRTTSAAAAAAAAAAAPAGYEDVELLNRQLGVLQLG